MYDIRDLVGDNKIANCVFYLTKKSNQPEDGSQLEPKHVVDRNNIRMHFNKIMNLVVFDNIFAYIL